MEVVVVDDSVRTGIPGTIGQKPNENAFHENSELT